jgi:carbonic anhydrase
MAPQIPTANRLRLVFLSVLCAASGLGWSSARANEAHAEKPAKAEEKIEMPLNKKKLVGEITTTSAANAKDVGNQVREALGTSVPANKRLNVVVSGKGDAGHSPAPATPQTSRALLQARAAALAAQSPAGTDNGLPGGKPSPHAVDDGHGGVPHWAYEGEAGPQNWAKLKPEFNVCALGKRQSPINIQDSNTLAGPAEPVQFNYNPSNGVVVNNGHTIQVNVDGNNSITVRGSRYQLLQFHFHTPSEEQVNYKRYAMVTHLVHKSEEGQLAVVAVLLEPGESNALVNKVWTYMPLDQDDSVRMPQGLLDLNEILPKDQRYYQFMGSLTTPPCTEGVLWMVLKQPVQLSQAQFRLFTQLYPNNARPIQPLNARPVRDAQ